MPITLKVDTAKSLTIFMMTGEPDIDEIHNAIKSFWEAHELTVSALWDVRYANLNNLKSSDIESIAAIIRQYAHRFEERKAGKTAIVASSDLQYGLSRILGTFYEI
jgi:RNA polymerase-interacting CarD/CdnL/TRCF family regulator